MKKILFLLSAIALGLTASAQSINIYQGENKVSSFSPADMSRIEFSTADPTGTIGQEAAIDVKAKWCSIGTSITWYNNNVKAGAFTRGYQDRVMDKLAFAEFVNVGDNGGCVARSIGKVVKADYYTIEHGINDWGHSTPVGTIDDYINNTNNGTFAADYRRLVDAIYAANPDALVVLCTPRKGYGFPIAANKNYLPDNCEDALNGIYLRDYANLIRQIAQYESFPVADFYAECGGQRNLASLSIDVALHPNDAGYQMMANVLVKAFKKIIID